MTCVESASVVFSSGHGGVERRAVRWWARKSTAGMISSSVQSRSPSIISLRRSVDITRSYGVCRAIGCMLRLESWGSLVSRLWVLGLCLSSVADTNSKARLRSHFHIRSLLPTRKYPPPPPPLSTMIMFLVSLVSLLMQFFVNFFAVLVSVSTFISRSIALGYRTVRIVMRAVLFALFVLRMLGSCAITLARVTVTISAFLKKLIGFVSWILVPTLRVTLTTTQRMATTAYDVVTPSLLSMLVRVAQFALACDHRALSYLVTAHRILSSQVQRISWIVTKTIAKCSATTTVDETTTFVLTCPSACAHGQCWRQVKPYQVVESTEQTSVSMTARVSVATPKSMSYGKKSTWSMPRSTKQTRRSKSRR